MKKSTLFIAAAALLFVYSCKNKSAETANISLTPEAGTSYHAGVVIPVKLTSGSAFSLDSVVYFIDSTRIASKKDTSALLLKTDTLYLGPRVLTAKVYNGGKSQDVSTNVVLYAAKAPVEYTYTVEKTFPHDTGSYTEGLVYHDGFLYESGGGYLIPPNASIPADGQSSLRKVDLTTGKVVQKVMVDPHVFGEGISIVGDKIFQLTWTSKIAYEYDLNSLKLLRTLPNNVGVEGWGMCTDGNKLYMDDSTNRIWFLDKTTYQAKGFIDVYDDKKAIDSINELEYVDGKLYANIYQTNDIIIVDPKTGAVLGRVDLSKLYPEPRTPPAEVLNGIAWDDKGKRLFVTGKKWQHLYQVKFTPK